MVDLGRITTVTNQPYLNHPWVFMAHYIGTPPKFSTRLNPDLIEKSPYFWWWRFLGLNRDYIATCEANGQGPLAALYRDFGDVRVQRANPYAAFKDWWGAKDDNHGRLFQERSLFPQAKALQSRDDWEPVMGEYPHAVIVVDVHLGVKKAQDMVARAIKGLAHFKQLSRTGHGDPILNDEIQRTDVEFGKPEGRVPLLRRYSTAKYRLTANVDRCSMNAAFQAYVAMANAGFPNIKSLTSAQKLSLAEAAELIEKIDKKNGQTPGERLKRTANAGEMLSAYYKEACNLITNVGNGYFPEIPPQVFSDWDEHSAVLHRMARRDPENM